MLLLTMSANSCDCCLVKARGVLASGENVAMSTESLVMQMLVVPSSVCWLKAYEIEREQSWCVKAQTSSRGGNVQSAWLGCTYCLTDNFALWPEAPIN